MLINCKPGNTIIIDNLSLCKNKTKNHKIAFLHFLMLLCLTVFTLPSAAQKKDFPGKTIRTPPVSKLREVTISGNIKQLALQGAMTDAFAFGYTDLVTGKDVVIPLKRDSSGNYSVKVPIPGPYQQIQLFQGQKIRGEVYFGGLITHEFYVKPGEPMEFNFYLSADYRNSSVVFKGNIATANSQQEAYQRSLSSAGFSVVFDYSKLNSVKAETYGGFKKYVSERLNAALLFNNTYFKKHPADPFLQQQADNDLRYEAANVVIQGVFKSKSTDPGLTRFLSENKIKIWNPLALGNDRYKTFIDQYYLLLTRSAQEAQGDYTVMFQEVAVYLLEKHPELSAEDRQLALMFSDSAVRKTEKDFKAFNDRLMSSYANEYAGLIDTRFVYNYLTKVSDPDLRNLFLTRLLQEKVEKGDIAPVQPLIERYKRMVKGGLFKEIFLKKYNNLYKRTVQSKLPPGTVIADAASLREGKVFDDLIKKHKGKVVYIDIWATWCQPCLMEMKNSQTLREKFRGKDVAFVYLCISSPQEPLWRKLIALHAIEGENYWLNDKQREELNRTFSIRSVPRHLLVDKQGKVSDQDAQGPGSSKTAEDITALLGS